MFATHKEPCRGLGDALYVLAVIGGILFLASGIAQIGYGVGTVIAAETCTKDPKGADCTFYLTRWNGR